MSEQRLTGYQIQGYAQHLKLEEKSEATLEKYLRDIRAFAAWAVSYTHLTLPTTPYV